MTKSKRFDCVAMKREAAERIFDQTKALSPEEQLAFWRAGEESLRKIVQQAPPPRRVPKIA